MSDRFEVVIKVSGYAKQYLINNCGNPVDLSQLPDLNKIFVQKLRKPLFRHESLNMASNTEYVCIVISEDTFRRYGWELTKTDQMDFNNIVERRVKFIMRNFVASKSAIGQPIAKVIRDFQEKFNFPEEVWSYEAIKKDLFRHTEIKRNPDIESFIQSFDRKLYKMFVDNLSDSGTISKTYKNELSKV